MSNTLKALEMESDLVEIESSIMSLEKLLSTEDMTWWKIFFEGQ